MSVEVVVLVCVCAARFEGGSHSSALRRFEELHEACPAVWRARWHPERETAAPSDSVTERKIGFATPIEDPAMAWKVSP